MQSSGTTRLDTSASGSMTPYAVGQSEELSIEESRRLCQYSLDIVCITDFCGKILWSNGVECSITGFSREELDKITLMQLTHPDDLHKVFDGLQDVSQGVLRPCTEIRTLCKDGSYKWISWSGVPLIEEQKIYAIGRDVSAQKHAESMVRKLAAIVQASKEAIIGIDGDGLISSWNKGAEMLYGYSAEEILKQPVTMLLASGRVLDFDPANSGNILDQLEDFHKCKNGRSINVSVSSFPVPDEGGNIGWAAIVRDITLQKEAERSIADFYSITSHELRTPLSSVRGVLSLLDNGVVDPGSEQGKDLIGMARSSSDRLVRLVNDILDLRKIESGSLVLNWEEIEAEDILRSALASVKGIALEAGVEIKTEMMAYTKAQGDKDRLTQVLTNLLSNAIKYSKTGQTVTVKIDQQVAGRIRFSVIDQGPGIRAEQVPKLFKKFGQLDSSDSRPKEGIGLGLFVARSIIEQHYGTIGVLPSENGGCRFWFEISVD